MLHLVYVCQTSGKRLGDWAYQQFEVVTDKPHSASSAVWNVEEHRYTRGRQLSSSSPSSVSCVRSSAVACTGLTDMARLSHT